MLTRSHFIDLNISERLHLMQIQGHPEGPVAFLVHGSIENGRIFYSPNKPKGLAWFLAQQGWDVFIADLAGRGLSLPSAGSGVLRGQSETILEEIPHFLAYIQTLRPAQPMVWGAHSWGGILLAACLARFPEYLKHVSALVFFASKRRVAAQNPEKWLKIDLIWCGLAHLLTRLYGYLPAKAWKLGAENESQKTHAQTAAWVRSKQWLDGEDRFDYAATLQTLTLPPCLFLAGAADYALGHPKDVQAFRAELQCSTSDFWLLGRQNGFSRDYGHIDMLTHPLAPEEIFPRVLDWLTPYTSTVT